MTEVLLDALTDTLKIFPFLFLIYIFLEYLENNKGFKNKTKRMLNGKFAPLFGTLIGIVPQCGFSVITTKLYCEKFINIGTLLAVYIATSDEALPILFSNPESFGKILPLLLIKIAFALVSGFSINAVFNLIAKKRPLEITDNNANEIINIAPQNISENKDSVHSENGNDADGCEVLNKVHCCNCHDGEEFCESHHHKHNDLKYLETHKEDKYYKLKKSLLMYLAHPLIHSLKIIFYIFIVNFILGIIIFYIGEDNFSAFLMKSKFMQPALTALIGLIPNCASSVIITQLYALDSLSLGAAVAGLSVNAGLGYAILFKQNKNIKENLLIIGYLYVTSVILGTVIMLLS